MKVAADTDDRGLLLELGGSGESQPYWRQFHQALFDQVRVTGCKQIPLNQAINLAGDGAGLVTATMLCALMHQQALPSASDAAALGV